MDILKRIKVANLGRDPERLAMKYHAMRTNPFVFLRGTCHLFYDRLPKGGVLKSAPLTWCCGDLHLENFGSYKGDNRLVYFDINDFDEAALAPASWDISRVMTSILVGANTYGITQENASLLCTQFLDAYATFLTSGKARWIERETADGLVKTLLDQLQQRKRIDFLNARTIKKGKLRQFKLDGKKTLPVTNTQRKLVTHAIEQFAKSQVHPEFYEVLDVARRIAGTGSLGVDRYTILVQGKGSPNQNYLLDMKQALPSSIARHLPTIQPVWNNQAERVVVLQQRMQAVSMAFLHSLIMNNEAYVLRGLQPIEDRVPIAQYHDHIEYLSGTVRSMAQCLAWAQLRSSGRQGSAIADDLIDFAQRKKWRNKLTSLAYELTDQVKSDWAIYCEGYDNNMFMSN
jgi:uncharacterized protein (DUF2252 family)